MRKRRRRNIFAAVAVLAFGCLYLATQRATRQVSWSMDMDDNEVHYSLERWTAGTYAWAAFGAASFAVMVYVLVAAYLADARRDVESTRHGFPLD